MLHELNSSSIQSYLFSSIAKDLNFEVSKGPNPTPFISADGPYDRRLGYTYVEQFSKRLRDNGFLITSQARVSRGMERIKEWGLFPIYREKTNGGLNIEDAFGQEIYSMVFPSRIFESFEAIPSLISDTLLLIENRELLSASFPTKNPAFEWKRFSRAIVDLGIKFAKEDHNVPGGSTLATQIEKYRHSGSGLTVSPFEKLIQMATASIRAYLDGENTLMARKRIVRDYINSMPLAAIPNYGEVNGLGDGLWAWYDSELSQLSVLLRRDETQMTSADLKQKASAYKQVLSMFIAQRRPSYYLRENREALKLLANRHLRLMASRGIISPALRDAALPLELPFRGKYDEELPFTFLQRKAANSIRTWLLSLLELRQLYELDRLDLAVKSTLDYEAQQKVGELLSRMTDPKFLQEQGFLGERLLSTNIDLSKVTYSATLFERTPRGNLLRVQTDNLNQPLNINEGVKLDLGSTAKLRTLIHYLEIIESLYVEMTKKSSEELRKLEIHPSDKLSAWMVEYLGRIKNPTLDDTLKAALARTYSASPEEVFFTGGGQHTFENFKREDNFKTYTLSEALRYSTNLVFIRLMRDVVNHHIYHDIKTAKLLSEKKEPRRREYLARFAEMEGRVFLRRFYKKYQGKNEDEIWEIIFEKVRRTPQRLAAVFRAVDPKASFESYKGVLRKFLPETSVSDADAERYFKAHERGLTSLLDRGYIAKIHPLELWVASYLIKSNNALFGAVDKDAATAKQEVYRWLFESAGKDAQNTRIRITLETEAFSEIHRAWKRLGYPFTFLTPSYATAIGSSADRPSALAELMGIIVNDGVRLPAIRVEELQFAKDTPFEVNFKVKVAEPKQVLSPEIVRTVKLALADVVAHGTAQRVSKVYKDKDGSFLAIGGKTGTGDQRFEVYGAGGKLIESRAVNRTATFVFYIGDRFFGTIVAYVPGKDADKYKFTSGLPAQILKVLQPVFEPLINR